MASAMPTPSPSRVRDGDYDRDALVATARDSIARGSQSFAMASKLFDRPTRERAWLLYAWCRKCDDLADGQDHGGAMRPPVAIRLEPGRETFDEAPPVSTALDTNGMGSAEEALAEIRDKTERALAGAQVGDPAFDALGLVAAECAIPHHLPRDLIEGFALDAADWRPRTEADLLRYCYHVAGVVGIMMAIVMGVDPDDEDTLKRACDLGLAFQLANIARDISEDDAAGRCYLPVEWLVETDIPPGEHMKPRYRQRLAMLAGRMSDMAEKYEASARIGARKLPFRSRWAVLAAAGIYGDIAREVKARGERARDHRVVTRNSAYLGWVIWAFGHALQRT
jgi:15-cis-phytoene synthase